MKSLFTAYPMFRVLCIWLLGILTDYFWKISIERVLLFSLSIICICLVLAGPLKRSMITWVALFCLSILFNQSFFAFKHQKPPTFCAAVFQVISVPKEKPKTWEVMVKFLVGHEKMGWESPNLAWKAKGYFSKKMAKPILGQIWFLSDSLKAFDPPQFPFEKNWSAYYQERGVAGLFFVKEKNARLIRVEQMNDWTQKFKEMQSKLLESFSAIPTRVNREVVEAMVLGETEGIDEELQMAYTSLGAVHILSVSGMHLGILFLVLNSLLGRLSKRFPVVRVPSTGLVLLVIWIYAGITGFSAPALRATWVFTFILIAKLLNRPIQAVNLLATSCLILLIFNPLDLFNIGFQLSYLAVLGILWFQKPIQNWFTFTAKKRWMLPLKFWWESTSVAISAQLFTFPLVIYYFHQFPQLGLYFFINPILMLLSSLGLIMGFGLLAFSPIIRFWEIQLLINWMGKGVDFVFEMMHQLMRYFSGPRFPVYSFLHFPLREMGLVYLFLFCLLLWCKGRKAWSLWLANSIVICLGFYYGVEVEKKFGMKSEQKLVKFRKSWLAYRLENRQLYVLGPAKLIQNKKWFAAHITPMVAGYAVLDTHLINEKPRPFGPGLRH